MHALKVGNTIQWDWLIDDWTMNEMNESSLEGAKFVRTDLQPM